MDTDFAANVFGGDFLMNSTPQNAFSTKSVSTEVSYGSEDEEDVEDMDDNDSSEDEEGVEDMDDGDSSEDNEDVKDMDDYDSDNGDQEEGEFSQVGRQG